MSFFPRQLERINPHDYIYRNRYELTFSAYPVLRLTVRALPDLSSSGTYAFLPRDEEREILLYFGFDPTRLMRIELRANGTAVYTQETA